MTGPACHDGVNRESATLSANGWPVNPEQFTRMIAATRVEPDDPVFPHHQRIRR
jgi:hypothetical protein